MARIITGYARGEDKVVLMPRLVATGPDEGEIVYVEARRPKYSPVAQDLGQKRSSTCDPSERYVHNLRRRVPIE